MNGPRYLKVVSLPPTFGCIWLGLDPSVEKKILHSGVPVTQATGVIMHSDVDYTSMYIFMQVRL